MILLLDLYLNILNLRFIKILYLSSLRLLPTDKFLYLYENSQIFPQQNILFSVV